MTITLELKPEEFKVLRDRAQAEGVDIQTILLDLVAQILPAPTPQEKPNLNARQKAAIALLQEWMAEKDQLSDEELERNDRDFEDFKSNMNRWRAEEGRPPAFP